MSLREKRQDEAKIRTGFVHIDRLNRKLGGIVRAFLNIERKTKQKEFELEMLNAKRTFLFGRVNGGERKWK